MYGEKRKISTPFVAREIALDHLKSLVDRYIAVQIEIRIGWMIKPFISLYERLIAQFRYLIRIAA